MQTLSGIRPAQKIWERAIAHELNPQTLKMLFFNKIGVVLIPGFMSSQVCEGISTELTKCQIGDYEGVSPPIGRLGITQFEAVHRDKNWYFSQVQQHQSKLQDICKENVNPLDAVMHVVRSVSGSKVERAHEDKHGKYFAGLVRAINDTALIHADYAPFQAQGWSIQRARYQLAWNVYLTEFEGGTCRVYEHPWDENRDEFFRRPGSYGYRREMVLGDSFVEVKPQKGDLVLFNSRNFHEVDRVTQGQRLSAGSFIGKIGNDIAFWS